MNARRHSSTRRAKLTTTTLGPPFWRRILHLNLASDGQTVVTRRSTTRLLVSEYGAGSYPGLHALPGSGAPSEFSAELREEILKATWVAFDELRKDGELQGEQMHALHDFKQRGGTYHDVGGMNFKGLYARDRSPKDHARVALSERYGRIARGEDEGRCS